MLFFPSSDAVIFKVIPSALFVCLNSPRISARHFMSRMSGFSNIFLMTLMEIPSSRVCLLPFAIGSSKTLRRASAMVFRSLRLRPEALPALRASSILSLGVRSVLALRFASFAIIFCILRLYRRGGKLYHPSL